MDTLYSFIEEQIDITPRLRVREGELMKIVKALQDIQGTKEWSSLKTLLFDDLSESLRKLLLIESKKENPDSNKLNRLSGQLLWAERYADLSKLEAVFVSELTNIKKQLYGKTQKD